MRCAILNDSCGNRGAHAGKLVELAFGGRVDVDESAVPVGLRSRARGGRLDADRGARDSRGDLFPFARHIYLFAVVHDAREVNSAKIGVLGGPACCLECIADAHF